MGRIRIGHVGPAGEGDLHLNQFDNTHNPPEKNVAPLHQLNTVSSAQDFGGLTSLSLDFNVECFLHPGESDLPDILNALKENRHVLPVMPTTLLPDSIKEIIKTSHESKVKCYPANPVFFSKDLQQHLSELAHPDYISLRRFFSFEDSDLAAALFHAIMNDVMIVLYLMKHDMKRCVASVIRNNSDQIQMIEARLEFSHSKVANLLYSNAILSEPAGMEVFRNGTIQPIALLPASLKNTSAGRAASGEDAYQEWNTSMAFMHRHFLFCLKGISKEELTPELWFQTSEITRAILKSIDFLNEE